MASARAGRLLPAILDMPDDRGMPQITRTVTLADLSDLLDRVPHANLAFETPAGIAAIPVGFRYVNGRFWVGVPRHDEAPASGTHAMLLVDDGWYYFDLRGFRVRGMLSNTPVPPALGDTSLWLELAPGKVNAWDYGAMRPRVAR